MSGIYLKGVGMPEKGSLRVIIHSDGKALIDCGPVYEEAEALIVPDHGDLIDASEIMTTPIYNTVLNECFTRKESIDDIIAHVCDVPPTAVIPADKNNGEVV